MMRRTSASSGAQVTSHKYTCACMCLLHHICPLFTAVCNVHVMLKSQLNSTPGDFVVGHNSMDHCNAHSSHSLYRDMRSAVQRSAASGSVLLPAPAAAGSSPSVPRRQSLPALASQPSGGSAAAVSRPSTGPVPPVPAAMPSTPPCSAAQHNAVKGESATTHDRAQCTIIPFRNNLSLENHLRCYKVCSCAQLQICTGAVHAVCRTKLLSCNSKNLWASMSSHV